MTEYPISATCPQCGGTEYTCRKPERLVAFVSDRVCRACNTRYTPPTPVTVHGSEGRSPCHRASDPETGSHGNRAADPS